MQDILNFITIILILSIMVLLCSFLFILSFYKDVLWEIFNGEDDEDDK